MNADNRASVEWVSPLPDSELVRLAFQHGEVRPPVERGPDRCDRCGEPYPCVRLRLAVEVLEARGIDLSDPAGPWRRSS